MAKLCTTHCTQKMKAEDRICVKTASGHDDKGGCPRCTEESGSTTCACTCACGQYGDFPGDGRCPPCQRHELERGA